MNIRYLWLSIGVTDDWRGSEMRCVSRTDLTVSVDLTTDHLAAIEALYRQLTQREVAIEPDQLRWFGRRPENSIVFALDRDRIIGAASLVEVCTLLGRKGLIEDVVVDKAYRGNGIGKTLMLELIAAAKLHGLRHLDLTSHPRRVAANKLYRSLGFEERETNIYRLMLPENPFPEEGRRRFSTSERTLPDLPSLKDE